MSRTLAEIASATGLALVGDGTLTVQNPCAPADAGANDLGGTLMNESITRAAGAQHGEEFPPDALDDLIRRSGRNPRQRTTLYADVPSERQQRSRMAQALTPIINPSAKRYERTGGEPRKRSLVRPGLS